MIVTPVDVRFSPLKAFINEHKPRKPPRRTQRTKDVRPKQEFPDESDASAMEFQSRPTTHLDTTAQESSSQTSSADNGDPQTPSPLYSEPVVTRVDSTQTTESNGLDGSTVDPHFARLLNALTLSAKPNGAGDGKPDYVPPAGTALPLSSVLPGALEDVPTSENLQPRKVLTANAATAGKPATVVYSRPSPKSSKPSSMAVHSNDLSNLSELSSGPQVSPPAPSQSTVSSGVTSQSPSTKSPTHSRRSSMITADLSPYLARPAGIPMNGKRLRQLALLEAVADESSRMTIPASRPTIQPPSPHEASHTPLSSNNVMSHNFTNLSAMYPNTHGPYVHPGPQTGPFNPPSPDNAFTVRPRTSNSFRAVPNYPQRPFNARASMNQAQLLSALSGSPYPSAQNLQRPPISPMPNLNSHSPSTYPRHSIPTAVPGAPIFRTGPHPPAVGRGPPPPLSVLPLQAVSGPITVQGLPSTPRGSSNFGFSRATANSQNSQLLSILNRGSGQ